MLTTKQILEVVKTSIDSHIEYNSPIIDSDRIVSEIEHRLKSFAYCTGGDTVFGPCPREGEFIEGCDGGCMYPGA